MITEILGLDKLVRYMDDVTIYAAAKKALHNADVQIRKMLGQRFRLKLKKNRQVCKFFYQGKRKAMGRPLDFMGFVFYRDKTIIRKRIMLKATQTARHLHKERGRAQLLPPQHRSHAELHGLVFLHRHLRVLQAQDQTEREDRQAQRNHLKIRSEEKEP